MNPKPSRPIWLERFGVRLLQLEPSMDALTAAWHAVDVIDSAQDLAPEEAADIFDRTGGAGPDDPGAPE